jgi:hypothetical protein
MQRRIGVHPHPYFKEYYNMATTQNVWLDRLIAALTAKQSHEAALTALIKHHGGKRTMELMQDLLSGIRAIHPTTKAELSVRMGTPNVSFPDKGVGYQTWKEHILPHLPKLRAATGGKKSHKTSPKELAVLRIKGLKSQGFTRLQLLAAIELTY